MNNPVHLVTHRSRAYAYMWLTACSTITLNLTTPKEKLIQFTAKASQVTCKKCLRKISLGKVLDPISRMDKTHLPCIINPKELDQEIVTMAAAGESVRLNWRP